MRLSGVGRRETRVLRLPGNVRVLGVVSLMNDGRRNARDFYDGTRVLRMPHDCH